MPRRIIKKITPRPETIRNRWYLRVFGARAWHPGLWSLQRRTVTAAFGAGLAICFVPLPVHLLLAGLVAIIWRLNLPTILATVLLVNPFTVVPVYYMAYRTGSAVLGTAPQPFHFQLNWQWLQYGLGPMWKPFLVGCVVCAVLAGFTGWISLEGLWRWSVTSKYRSRRDGGPSA